MVGFVVVFGFMVGILFYMMFVVFGVVVVLCLLLVVF